MSLLANKRKYLFKPENEKFKLFQLEKRAYFIDRWMQKYIRYKLLMYSFQFYNLHDRTTKNLRIFFSTHENKTVCLYVLESFHSFSFNNFCNAFDLFYNNDGTPGVRSKSIFNNRVIRVPISFYVYLFCDKFPKGNKKLI